MQANKLGRRRGRFSPYRSQSQPRWPHARFLKLIKHLEGNVLETASSEAASSYDLSDNWLGRVTIDRLPASIS